MANVNRPCGLVPLEYRSGAPYTGKARMYYIPSANGSAFAIGDPVALGGSADSKGVASIVLATAGGANLVLGAIVGFGGSAYGGPGAVPGSLETTVIPATKTRDYYVLVSDDPDIVYMVQEDNAGTPFTAAEVGLNASLKAGTNNGYTSTWVLDNAGEATTQALQLKLLGLVQTPDNAFGVAAKWKVLINNHSFNDGQAGV
jgi:hypothetical protein